MATLTRKIRAHVGTAFELGRLFIRHRGCITCIAGEIEQEAHRLRMQLLMSRPLPAMTDEQRQMIDDLNARLTEQIFGPMLRHPTADPAAADTAGDGTD